MELGGHFDRFFQAIKQFVKFSKQNDLTQINTTHFNDFTKVILKRKLKYGTLKTYKFGINLGFNKILKNNIDVSGMPNLETPRVKHEFFEKEEVLLFFSKISNLKHRAIIELLYSTGIEIKELINIKITDIPKNKKVIIVRNSKNEIFRQVYLSSSTLKLLREYYNTFSPKKYLFEGQNANEQISVRTIESIFKKTAKIASINKQLSLKSLRLSYIKHLTEDGIPLNSILAKLKITNADSIKNYLDICYPLKEFNSSPIDTLQNIYDEYDFFDTSDLEHLLIKIQNEKEKEFLEEGIKCFKANALRAGVVFSGLLQYINSDVNVLNQT